MYTSLQDFIQKTSKSNLTSGWKLETLDAENARLVKTNSEFIIPELEIYINSGLNFTIRVWTLLLPETHSIYRSTFRSLHRITLQNLLNEIKEVKVCEGLKFPAPNLKQQTLPRSFNPDADSHEPRIIYRSETCSLLTQDTVCENCGNTQSVALKIEQRKCSNNLKPAKLKAPVSITSPDRLKLTLQGQRLQNKQLQEEMNHLKEKLVNESLPVSAADHKDFVDIFKAADTSTLPPFMKLFWEEQQKYVQTSQKGIRYHPAIIRKCLSLLAKSPAAYDELRYDEKKGTGFLILPSKRRLRDYKNYIRPERGFNHLVIKELKEKTKDFSEHERFMVLCFDEMKVEENLVWDKHNGELIGFVDLGDSNLHEATGTGDEIASHILVFLVRGVVNPIKFSLATFATKGATATQIFPLFWKAVSILELSVDLKVIAATADGASPNKTFFRMHKHMDGQDHTRDVVYRVRNIYSTEDRYIYFISDPPHLVKTARNCLSNSGAGRETRYMWNNGKYLLWSHITQLYYEDQDCGLKLLPKLKSDHINLTPFSVMNVSLAAQILSQSVSAALKHYGSPEAEATSKFCDMMDRFFDCVNGRYPKEHLEKRKPMLAPYSSVDDDRLRWLEEDFLQYFDSWKESIEARQGNYTTNAKSNMFISWQTYEGIRITCYSVTEAIKYLLQNGVSYVLPECFCQDPLENYYGTQRSLGRRKDNPTVYMCGYNDNTIRNLKSFPPIAGNVRGESNIEVDSKPLPCRISKRK